MFSLAIMLVLLLVPLFFLGWLAARTARAVGSTRGRFSVGLWAMSLSMLVGIASFIPTVMATSLPRKAQSGLNLLVSALVPVVTFFILKRAFRLSIGRTFAPMAVVIAVSIAQIPLTMLVVRPNVVEAMVLSANSMSPTVDEGDRFLVNKLLAPRRWDLIAYRNDGDKFCKRLIGLPGESVRFVNGSIEIDGRIADVPPILAGRCHAAPIGMPPRDARYQDGEVITLNDDEYFLIGDNIDRSADSRMYGPSKASSFVGVVDLIYWPPGRFSIIR